MKKPTLTEKAARKALEHPTLVRQWTMYTGMFGPLLTPAYPGDDRARLQLIALLEQIGRRELDAARKSLAGLEKSCGLPGPAEETLRHFLLGLMADAAGDADAMVTEYQHVLQARPDFYLPWQKVAQAHQQQFRFEEAAACLDKAISLRYTQRSSEMVLGGLYASLAMCQLMLHQADAARRTLEIAERISPFPTQAAQAMLCAVTGDRENALHLCTQGRAALVYPQVQQILAGTHPHFALLPDALSPLPELEHWLPENVSILNSLDDQAASDLLSRQLMQFFPCMTQYPAAAAFSIQDGKRVLTLQDFHGVTPAAVLDQAAAQIHAWPVRRTH